MCTLLAAKHLDRLFAAGTAGSGSGPRDAAVAVHPGLVDTALARGYFKQMAPAALRPLTDPFFEKLFCPYALRRRVWGWAGWGVRAGFSAARTRCALAEGLAALRALAAEARRTSPRPPRLRHLQP